jgi:hypothetical protein
MNFDRRLRALEARISSELVTLYFQDGSTKEIPGQHEFLLQLFIAACKGQPSPEQAGWFDLIHRASAMKPCSGHLIELVQGAICARLEGVLDLPDDECDDFS